MSGSKFSFIDLFCGIGGFHQAMEQAGGKCVFASEIDHHCISVYAANYGLNADCDITKVDAANVPPHQVLCGGFPCQAFSKAGKREGINDTRGTLFFEIERILRTHRPQFILLENVRNLVGHDNGRTWRTITSVLKDIGYRLTADPLILSPHQFGVPQLRERVYIAGVYDPDNADTPIVLEFDDLKKKDQLSIYSILDPDVPRNTISSQEDDALTAWDEFIHGINSRSIGFPVNIDYFKYEGDTSALPAWKRQHIERNKALYAENKAFIDDWLKRHNGLAHLTPTMRKLEWQCSDSIDSVFEGIIQMRPSGIRVKRPTAFPALVAMVQIPIIGRYRRRLTPRECARLQSFPDSFILCENEHQAYKQFGNSVNVKVLSEIFARLLKGYGPLRPLRRFQGLPRLDLF